MNITLTINGITHETDVSPNETLLATLRGLGFHGVKFGDEQGFPARTPSCWTANPSTQVRC